MINALLPLLLSQLAGEAAARALGLTVPGPVLGMLILLAAFALFPALVATVRPVAQTLLGNLSLLFVPAGVGIVGHINTLGNQGPAILLARRAFNRPCDGSRSASPLPSSPALPATRRRPRPRR